MMDFVRVLYVAAGFHCTGKPSYTRVLLLITPIRFIQALLLFIDCLHESCMYCTVLKWEKERAFASYDSCKHLQKQRPVKPRQMNFVGLNFIEKLAFNKEKLLDLVSVVPISFNF